MSTIWRFMLQQVEKAYDYLLNFADAPERNLKFRLGQGNNQRGIYLREKHQLCKPSDILLTVEPEYLDNDSTGLWTKKLKYECQFKVLNF